MIRMNYINDEYTFESDEILRPYNSYIKRCLNDLQPVYAEYAMIYNKVDLEFTVMESVSDDMMLLLEAAEKSLLQKIGEKILELRDKFIEFADKVIDKIKTFTFNNKSNAQKLEKLLKEHPELKDETLMAVKDGTLNLNNIKSFKELNENYSEIIKLAKKGEIDPKTLRGKWEKVKEKFEDNEDKIIKATKVVTGVIGAAVALKTFSVKCREAEKQNNDLKAEGRRTAQLAYDWLNHASKSHTRTDNRTNQETIVTNHRFNKNGNVDNQYYESIINGQFYIQGKLKQAMGQNLNTIERMKLAIARFLDNHVVSDETKNRYHTNMRMNITGSSNVNRTVRPVNRNR